MGKNGYIDSILDTEDGVCYLCGKHTETCRHEIFGGSNRKDSKRLGLWVNLCPDCHNCSPKGVHFNRDVDLELKKDGQLAFVRAYPFGDFLAIFGKNYIWED